MPIVYHTQESLNAANALSCGILAAARKPAAGAAGAPHGPLQTVAVRNGPCGEPGKPATPAGSPAAQRTAAPSPRSVTTWATPPRTPFSDDSWLNFVRELQKNGSVPGAMRGDPESGVMCSTNVRPRAVTSFLRQPRKQTDLPPPRPAGAAAVYPSPCASTPEISHGSRLSSTSEDEGISPGLALDERPQPATDTIAVATHPRRPAIIVEVWRKDTQAHSDDEGHGASRPSSMASSEEEGPAWGGEWADADSPLLPSGARDVDIIRCDTSALETFQDTDPVLEMLDELREPMFSDDDVPDSWRDETESVSLSDLEENGVDEWAPRGIDFAQPVNAIPDGYRLDFSGCEGRVVMILPEEPLLETAEAHEEEDVPPRSPMSTEEYRQYRTEFEARLRKANQDLGSSSAAGLLTINGELVKAPQKLEFVGADLVIDIESDKSLDAAETRLSYLWTKPGPGVRSDLEDYYNEEIAQTAPWKVSGQPRGILKKPAAVDAGIPQSPTPTGLPSEDEAFYI